MPFMTEEPASEPVTPAQSSSSSSRKIVAVLLLVLAGAAAVASFPLWRDRAGFPTSQDGGFEVENLRAELSASNARLAQLEARLAQPMAAPASDETRLGALEQALRGLQSQSSATPSHLAADVETLTKQVAEMKKTAADAATLLRLADRVDQVDGAVRELQARRSSAAALLLGVGQLREAVNLGLVFDAELRTVKLLAGEDADSARAMEALKDRAATGIAPRLVLAERFETLAPALIRAEILPEGEGWQRRVMDRLLSLVTIRREDGSAAGSSAAAIVARAQAALSRGELAAAIAETESLTGGSVQAAAAWTSEAKARLAADKALSELAAHAIAVAGIKP
jgi:uroporphyrinogen-III synthase